MSFVVGQKVTCTNATGFPPLNYGEVLPVAGTVYTVRALVTYQTSICLRLVEITNPTAQYDTGLTECSFNSSRFTAFVPPPPPPPTAFALMVSTSTNRSSPITLNGATIASAPVCVFLPDAAPGPVTFSLDGGVFTHTEGIIPWDFNGTAADVSLCFPYTFTAGAHMITAQYQGGQTSASFSVGQQPPPPPPPPAALPTVIALMPNFGPQRGGTSVKITGTNFTGATQVRFGTAACPFAVSNATAITAIAPAGSGSVDVTVTTPAGTSIISSGDRYKYQRH
jgi:hypothetical protein